jgi:hypothetical protein
MSTKPRQIGNVTDSLETRQSVNPSDGFSG